MVIAVEFFLFINVHSQRHKKKINSMQERVFFRLKGNIGSCAFEVILQNKQLAYIVQDK